MEDASEIMAKYLIEFRFQGKAKRDMKQMIYEVDRRFRLHQVRRKRPVPHISLAGGFTTHEELRLVRDFKSLCEKTPFMNFWIAGWGVLMIRELFSLILNPDLLLIHLGGP